MSLILHIDTAVDTASICLTEDENVIGEDTNANSRESASWLQPAIRKMVIAKGFSLQQLKAVSVSAGPGSYTGLRVGMASAKGLCFALNIPLITVGTLEVMTQAAVQVTNEPGIFCPLIDARRMEVFTGLYNRNIQCVLPPQNMILDEHSFSDRLSQQPIIFFGNGSEKLKGLLHHQSAKFIDVSHNATSLAPLALQRFRQQEFADLAYAEPFYIKAFYTTQKKI